ncbi:MetQ/NlpA family ABC transporter substrate-binding protein [Streptomyces reniochalinae]|uniref:ABC transporter permease subunit n=1 Tax=Streptomyces reniochalinae TaxID=2250578 RepID=A0A367EL84_9ACTN|nr:ABC transporter permease subunit [Streptomyces reniochalinae]
MSWSEIQPLLFQGFWDTLYMVGWSTLIALVGGLPIGVLLVLTDRGGMLHNALVNKVVGAVVNVGRSLPFIILLIALIPFTRFVVGQSVGSTAAVVPLAIGAIPFFARLVETAIREVDRGLVEAVQAMGGGTPTVVFKALLPQALPSLVAGLTTTVIVLIGYSAMAGTVGGGGLGSVAVQYGYQRFETSVMIATVVALIVIVTAVQIIGDAAVRLLASGRGGSASGRGGSTADGGAGKRLARLGRGRTVALAAAVVLPLALIGYGIGQSGGDKQTLKIAASPTPHAEILEYVEKNLAEKEGIDLDIRKFNDYVVPNTATESGEVDANFFQHKPYLDDFNKKNGTHIVPVVDVELEPLGLYSKKVDSLGGLGSGDTVAVPNDSTNEGRALHLLAKHGLIELKPGAGQEATLGDIADKKGLTFKELEAAAVPRALDDVDAAVVNGNYAVDADLNPAKDALAAEKVAGNPYANFLAVKDGDQDDPRIRKLAKLLNSPQVEEFIEKKYKGAIEPAFGHVGS